MDDLNGEPFADWGRHTVLDERIPTTVGETLACTYRDALEWNATRFVDVDATVDTACGVAVDGSVVCVYLPDLRAGLPTWTCEPSGPFVSVAMADAHICALRPDGEVVCWGNNEYNQTASPDVFFRTLDANAAQSCGVDMDGDLHCWGTTFAWDYWSGPSFVPVGPQYRDIVVHKDGSCWLDRDGRVGCFDPFTYSAIYDEPSVKFTSLVATLYGVCGLRPNRQVVCWGDEGIPSPPGRFLSIDGGWYHACGIREDHTLSCWGEYDAGNGAVPEGRFTKVGAGGSNNCALDFDGYVTCWDGTETP